MFFGTGSSQYRMIGLMSGTSLDGLDICYCIFTKNGNGWEYSIRQSETVKYPGVLQRALREAMTCNAEILTQLDFEYGIYMGREVRKFTDKHNLSVDYIASHGHTVLHNPSKGFTLQIGKGAAIAAETGIPCITDFRSGDVCRGGQGAPLVPIGDRLLFSQFDICLNLGGIANISYDNEKSIRQAYDIGICNMLLNHLSGLNGMDFDKNGELGKSGAVIPELLNELESLPYFYQTPPKSLGREWFKREMLPLFKKHSNKPLTHLIRTAYEHISNRIASDCNKLNKNSMLVTGGGAKNEFLMELIAQKTKLKITIPDSQTIDFKEALIFAFLGVLFLERFPNSLSSVTGARSDSVGGCLYQ